jgi:hypothetical protein
MHDAGPVRFREESLRTMVTPAPIDIVFILRGERLSGVEDIEDPVERVFCRAAVYRIRIALGRLVCPTHRERPRVIASGPSAEQLSFSVEGCCQSLIDLALRRIP